MGVLGRPTGRTPTIEDDDGASISRTVTGTPERARSADDDVIFRSRLHNSSCVFEVVQASVNTGFSVLLCTNIAFLLLLLCTRRSSGVDAESVRIAESGTLTMPAITAGCLQPRIGYKRSST